MLSSQKAYGTPLGPRLKCDTARHNLGVGVTIIFEAVKVELENSKIIYVEPECVNYRQTDIANFVTCFIKSRKSRRHSHFYAMHFLIFVFLGIENDEIDTKIMFSTLVVSFV